MFGREIMNKNLGSHLSSKEKSERQVKLSLRREREESRGPLCAHENPSSDLR